MFPYPIFFLYIFRKIEYTLNEDQIINSVIACSHDAGSLPLLARFPNLAKLPKVLF